MFVPVFRRAERLVPLVFEARFAASLARRTAHDLRGADEHLAAVAGVGQADACGVPGLEDGADVPEVRVWLAVRRVQRVEGLPDAGEGGAGGELEVVEGVGEDDEHGDGGEEVEGVSLGFCGWAWCRGMVSGWGALAMGVLFFFFSSRG